MRPSCPGIRHLQICMVFLALVLGFMMRVNMSMAIVDMTNKEKENHFDWSHQTQSVVLSSFFWGYLIMQIPSGELVRRFGAKLMLTIPILTSAIISFILPLGAQFGGWQVVCGCRILQGLTQAALYPSLQQLISLWVPVEEKGTLSILIYAGAQLGVAIQMLISGVIASMWGWQGIFYANGVLATLWSVLYSMLGSDSPQNSKMISQKELEYINSSLGSVASEKVHPTPWRKILTSVPFWALIAAHCGHNWGFFTLMTEMPTYMAKVLNVNLNSNGVLSSLPYIATYILSIPMGWMTDVVLKKGWLTVSKTRKLFNSVGFCVPALALIGLSYCTENDIHLAIVLLVLTVGINASSYSGFMLVHVDLAPKFTASVMAISNCAASVVSFVAPLVCGFVVNDENDPVEWRKVFFLASALYLFLNLIFVIFGSAEVQPWNEPTEGDVEMKSEKKTTRM